MHGQHVTLSAIEPGEDNDLVAGSDIPQTFSHLGVKNEPRLGRAFVSLSRRGLKVGQRRETRPTAITSNVSISFSPAFPFTLACLDRSLDWAYR